MKIRSSGAWTTIVPVVLLIGCAPALQELAPRTDAVRAMERRTHDLVNEYRVKNRMKALIWNDIIRQRALIHSRNMATNKVAFSHTGFEARVNEIGIRIPFKSSAENIAMNWGYADPANKFVEGWLQSPGHLENIKGNFTQTGIGIALSADGTYYATQIFILNK